MFSALHNWKLNADKRVRNWGGQTQFQSWSSSEFPWWPQQYVHCVDQLWSNGCYPRSSPQPEWAQVKSSLPLRFILSLKRCSYKFVKIVNCKVFSLKKKSSGLCLAVLQITHRALRVNHRTNVLVMNYWCTLLSQAKELFVQKHY